MLIDLLQKDEVISRYLCNDCEENGIGIDIDSTIAAEDLLIVKVDSYYNANVHPQPKSPDCLIIQCCGGNTFIIYIVELRNIKSAGGFDVKEIEAKFITCLDDFMSQRFGYYFHSDKITYKNIRLIFISDPFGFKENPDRQLKMRGHKLDLLMSVRIPKYFNRHLYIDPKLPNPAINNCKVAM